MIVAHNDAAILGGLELWLARKLAALQARGHDVLLLCRNEDMKCRFEDFDVAAEVLHVGGQIALHDALRLGTRLRRLRPDGFLVSSFRKSWLAAMGGRIAGTPRIVARLSLEDYRPGRRITYRVAFRHWIHRIVANSDAIRAAVLKDLPGLDPSRVITLYNGVKPGRVRAARGAVRRELGLSPEARVLGALARLATQKRLDLLVRLVASLGSDTHAVVAGEGPERTALEALAAELGVADRIHFVGVRTDVADVLSAVDVYVVTSRSEGMSNSMLEAMAAGVPVVSTPVSGALEALGASPSGAAPGIVVDGGVRDLAREVGALLTDPARRREMGEAGRRRVADRFDWDQKVLAWETLLTRDVHANLHDVAPGPPG